MGFFDKLSDDMLPKAWERAGRHSSQGYLLTDLVGSVRVLKVAKMLHARSEIGRKIAFGKLSDRIMLSLNNRFRSHFFAGRFGRFINMPDAAEIYTEMLEDGEQILNMRSDRLRKALEVGTVMAYVKWCLQFGQPVPESPMQVLAIVHNMRENMEGFSVVLKSESKKWLDQRPNMRMKKWSP